MTDKTNEEEKQTEPSAGLYVFYDENANIQIGVSGDYSIGEAIFMLNAAKSNLELLQFRALRQQNTQQDKSRIILPG